MAAPDEHARGCELSSSDAHAHVLIVDDEPIVLEALAASLELDGFSSVQCCTQGEQALHALSQGDIDLVISDLGLPDGGDGEFLHTLAARYPELPRIVITGCGDAGTVLNAAREAQPFSVLAKPWCNRRLRDEICRALAWARSLKAEPNPVVRAEKRACVLQRAFEELRRLCS